MRALIYASEEVGPDSQGEEDEESELQIDGAVKGELGVMRVMKILPRKSPGSQRVRPMPLILSAGGVMKVIREEDQTTPRHDSVSAGGMLRDHQDGKQPREKHGPKGKSDV